LTGKSFKSRFFRFRARKRGREGEGERGREGERERGREGESQKRKSPDFDLLCL
jgi:hypothetical protein